MTNGCCNLVLKVDCPSFTTATSQIECPIVSFLIVLNYGIIQTFVSPALNEVGGGGKKRAAGLGKKRLAEIKALRSSSKVERLRKERMESQARLKARVKTGQEGKTKPRNTWQ